ncbi:MAG TPA: hypothetical protein VMB85_22840 [Bryobacteraceae bacterium]|jgi:hypothetical protein|nr:hypothetical protein [Bryobacteraceae bacterium]
MMEQTRPDTLGQLVGALLLQLADDVPDVVGLETVKADLLAASKSYETGTKQDLALRFYLATRSLFSELSRMRPKEAPKVFEAVAGAGNENAAEVGNETRRFAAE